MWQSTWETKLKKGNIGERLMADYLRDNGFIVYAPDTRSQDVAHPFDRLVASEDKKKLFVAEAKTKALRKHYPDTGIDIRHYNEYKHISDTYNIDILLFFVDEENGVTYGNFLSELEHRVEINVRGFVMKYPWKEIASERKIIYFPRVNMVEYGKIPPEYIAEINAHTTKNSIYKN